eukprot:1148188-Pelagomonas_calceolata.AAC.3
MANPNSGHHACFVVLFNICGALHCVAKPAPSLTCTLNHAPAPPAMAWQRGTSGLQHAVTPTKAMRWGLLPQDVCPGPVNIEDKAILSAQTALEQDKFRSANRKGTRIA